MDVTSKTIYLTVKPLYAKSSDKALILGDKKIVLRDFQAKTYEELQEHSVPKALFLEAPTGAGKTYIILTILANKNYDGVVGIYPTRKLAKDQYDSIFNVLLGAGEQLPLRHIGISKTLSDLRKTLEKHSKCVNFLPEREEEFISLWRVGVTNPEGETFERRALLFLLTSESMEILKLLLGKESKREAFLELVNKLFFNVDFVAIFTVPEYPYMIHEMSYGEFATEGEKLWNIRRLYERFLKEIAGDVDSKSYVEEMRGILRHYRISTGSTRDSLRGILEIYTELFRHPLFIDEFHLYTGLSEISLIALIFMYYAYYPAAKAIFSSATPNKKLQKLIEVVAEIFKVKIAQIKAGTSKKGEPEHLIRGETKVIFHCIETGSSGIAGLMRVQRYVPEIAYRIARGDPSKKTIVILDRVGLVLDACKRLREAVGEEKELVYVTSVRIPTKYCRESNMESLKTGKYDYIVGNLAIAQGIDLKNVERGIIYAKDVMSFIQRFGRVPRGGMVRSTL